MGIRAHSATGVFWVRRCSVGLVQWSLKDPSGHFRTSFSAFWLFVHNMHTMSKSVNVLLFCRFQSHLWTVFMESPNWEEMKLSLSWKDYSHCLPQHDPIPGSVARCVMWQVHKIPFTATHALTCCTHLMVLDEFKIPFLHTLALQITICGVESDVLLWPSVFLFDRISCQNRYVCVYLLSVFKSTSL